MTDGRARLELQRRLEEVLGGEHAMTLMEHLPGGEIATRGDLSALEQRVDLKLEALEHRLTASFRNELVAQTRVFVISIGASLATIASLAFAAARLT